MGSFDPSTAPSPQLERPAEMSCNGRASLGQRQSVCFGIAATERHAMVDGSYDEPGCIRRNRRESSFALNLARCVLTTHPQMFLIGRTLDSAPQASSSDLAIPKPTKKDFEAALQAIREALPGDCVSTDRDDLFEHGTNAWNCTLFASRSVKTLWLKSAVQTIS